MKSHLSSLRAAFRFLTALLAFVALLLPSAETRAANTVITNISANLLDSGSWSPGPAVPTAANDVVFDVNFWNSTFYLGFDTGYGNLTVGSINFLNTSGAALQDFTGDVGTEQDSVLVLAGGTGNSVPGANVSDLLYITNGVNVYIHGENGLGWPSLLRIDLATNGNFNIASGASAIISANITGTGFGLNRTGGASGALTVTGNLSFTGGFTNTAGFYTNNSLSTYAGPTVIKGGTNVFNSIASVGAVASALGAPADSTSGVIHFLGGNMYYNGPGSTSDRIINWSGGTYLYGIGSGPLILTGGITNSANQGITFRGAGTIVETGVINTGSGAVGRTDTGGTVILTNALNLFTGNFSISAGSFYIDTITNSGGACSIGKGTNITLGQLNGNSTCTLRLAVTNGSACDRSITVINQTVQVGVLENTVAGSTVTFSGNVISVITNVTTSPSLFLAGAGNGVLTGVIGANTNPVVAMNIVKTNAGTWTISGLNTNRGLTTVSGGTLLINGNASGATNTVTVASGGTLGGNGTNGGNVVVNGGGILAPAGLNTVGKLTLTNNLTLNGGTLYFDLSNVAGTGDQVVVGNALNVNGANNIVLSFPNGTAPAGTYTVITNISKSGSGSFALQGSYPNASLNITPTSVQVVVTGGGAYVNNLTWKGNVSAAWDTVTGNWATNGVGGALYADGNNVFFDDTLTANPVVSGGAVSPSTVSFNNSLTNYTIASAIGGTGTTLTKAGAATTVLTGANTYTSNTLVNAGSLVVSNGGAIYSPNATLNIGSGATVATATLGVGGALTVQTLLATNVINGVVTNSFFTFSGGTLITSNNNGLAANIVLNSNAGFTVNGNWTLNGGTNIIANAATNVSAAQTVLVGNGVNNVQVNVNSNAFWWHAIPAGSLATNGLSLTVGSGAATNTVFTVNGGVVSNVNTFQVGTGTSSLTNQLVITNGGQFTLGTNATFNYINGNYSSIIVAGTNGVGQRAKLDMGRNTGDRRLYVGNSTASTGNLLLVNSGGVLTNAGLQFSGCFGDGAIITNGGQAYLISGVCLGRSGGNTNYFIVGGFDGSGSNAYVSGTSLDVGGSGNGGTTGGTNNWALVDRGGFLKMANVYVGGHNTDMNSLTNSLTITNGGQVFTTGASSVGLMTNGVNNWAYVGGNFGTTNSLWNFGNQTLTIGAANATQPTTNNYVVLATNGLMTNVSSVILGGANSTLFLNGGTLAAGTNGLLIATNASTISATAYVQAGGAFIDSGTFTVTNGLPLTQDPSSTGGGLTKLGVGTLVLPAVNTYTGPTRVSAGRLVGTSGGSSAGSAVIVLAGATNTVQLVATNGQWTCAGLTNSNGSTLDLNFVGSAPSVITAPLSVTGNFDLNSANLAVRSVGAIGVGQYPLVKYGTVSGTLTPALSLPIGMVATLSNNTVNTSIDLVVTTGYVPPFAFYWAVGNGNWDFSTMNWKDTPAAGVTNILYTNNAPVVLDDSAGGTGTILVTNTTTITPSSLLVDVLAKNYTLSGAAIAGTATLTKTNPGTLTLNNPNTYAGNTLVNGGTLAVAGGGAINSPTNLLNVGSGSTVATNTLAAGGAITVQTLVATNNVHSVVANSYLNFTGGTLTTSNNNGLAANILLPVNTSVTMNSSWNLAAGTNLISNPGTNGTSTAYSLNVGNGTNNVQVYVAPGTTWLHAVPAGSQTSNTLNLVLGLGAATNNTFTVNGGNLIITNATGNSTPVTIGASATSAGNQLSILNGGQVVTLNQYPGNQYGGGGLNMGNAAGAANNSVIVAGTNAAGLKAQWNLNRDRFNIGASAGSTNNWVRVDDGGVVTNTTLFFYGLNGALFVTNGGQFYSSGLSLGRGGFNNSILVSGTNGGGSQSLLSFYGGTVIIGGASVSSFQPGTNNTVRVDAGGFMTNQGSLLIGGSGGFDSNSIANGLIITNGGQAFNTAVTIGNQPGCNSNYVTLGGGAGTSLWNLNVTALSIGNNGLATNNFVTLFSGGVLTNVTRVTLGGVNTTLTFNGGKLAAGTNGLLIAPSTNAVNPLNYVQAGGAVIDSVNFTVTNVLPLVQDPSSTGGGLTKLGVGTLVLTNVNTYTGSTLVSAGRLVGVSGGSSASSSVTVLAGATNSVLTVSPNGQWICAALANNDGSTLDFNLGLAPSVSAAPLSVTGAFALTNANVSVRSTSYLGLGQYPLVKYGSYAGTLTPATLSLPTGAAGYLSNNTVNASIDLVVTAASVPVVYWAGGSGNWNTTEQNWKDTPVTLAADILYQNAWPVVLDDSASGTGTILVTNTVAVSPASVVVDVTAKSYTISGSAITGGTTLTKSGRSTLTLNGVNTYTGDTVVNAGTLAVAGGGAIYSPTNILNIGSGATAATNALAAGGAITVKSLLATNVVAGVLANSYLSFTGGTLTTSNSSDLASSILLPSNIGLTINSSWNMNGGTNVISNVTTNNNAAASLSVGNNTNNVQVSVNPGATWWLAIPTNSISTNTLGLLIGANSATNNVLTINGGTLIATNKGRDNPGTIQVGASAASTGNQLIITNGGQVFSRADGVGGGTPGYVGINGSYNSLLVAGTNAVGQKSSWSLGNDRLQIGSGNIAYSNNSAVVTSGGQIANASLMIYGVNSSVTVTNGGQTILSGLTVGRQGYNSSLYVGGADSAGKATVTSTNGINIVVGGGQASAGGPQPGTNCFMLIDANGVVTNMGQVFVAGSFQSNDVYSVGNGIIITNGGQLFNTGNAFIGGNTNCDNNYITVGGGSGSSLWSMNNGTLSVGTRTISGGVVSASGNHLTLFSGGVLTNVSSVVLGGTNSALNFNGGALAAGTNGNLIATSATAVGATNYVQAGGAIIDTVTYSVTNVLPLVQDPGSTGGGLTKAGAGTLVLNAANSYSGATVVSAGTLLADNVSGSATGTGTVTVDGGATLGGTGTIAGQVHLLTGALATNVVGFPLTIGGAVTLNGNTMQVESLSALGAGDYVLITNTAGGITGSFASAVTVGGAGVTSPLSASIVTTGNEVILRVASGGGLPATGTNITFSPVVGNTFTLSWPVEYTGWQLWSNAVDVTQPSEWFLVPGSTAVNSLTITINPSLTNVFYRMQHP